MNCPADGTELKMADRQGIEIDYCPQCRGVWLDRGELDRIIERASAAPFSSSTRTERVERFEEHDRYRDDDDEKYYDKRGEHRYGKKKKRESFLGELFDFD